MPRDEEPAFSDCHGEAPPTIPTADLGSEDSRSAEVLLDPSQQPLGFGEKQTEGNYSQDADLQVIGRVERRWSLWQEFMNEQAQLDAWLGSTEQAVAALSPAHFTYSSAKEELRKLERLRSEAGSRLIKLDGLTQRNRTLTRLFQGAMQARLLAIARECGQRWDEVNAKVESIIGKLQLFIGEWEEFEEQREGLSLWLAEMDVRLTEIDHLTGSTCRKLKRLQSFQECVCENSARVNALLRRGEALMQRSDPADAHLVESRLLELLRFCSHVYNNIGRTHTRLLSMRLVFEDDWILPPVSDSGCPSESMLEGNGGPRGRSLDPPSVLDRPEDIRASDHHAAAAASRRPLHPPPPPPPHTNEQAGLEWDPSVDIGRSLSHDDADSSYFSAGTGLCLREDQKRWSYFSSLDAFSDISHRDADVTSEEWPDPPVPAGPPRVPAGPPPSRRKDLQPIRFGDGRVKAWLQVQSSAPSETRSKAVQTDEDEKVFQLHHHHLGGLQHGHDHTRDLVRPSSSRDSELHPLPGDEEEDETSCWEEPERLLPELRCSSIAPAVSSHSRFSSSSRLLRLLLATAVALLGALVLISMEQPCHRSNRMSQTFHFTLRYVNGPPPT
ncbi:hypothetical protein OJAV_G00134290 [Oryzias javanicus]|uniref:KASH domain-containing protein n=1 Tax=Oryzias javanicus TaxID=123683 RepID=A0A3S2U8G5_ORYJA|nr:hypothetical protein OJAV_G00134290 [Oryzias javanicus]